MPPLLLTAHDCTGHVHLVVGSNAIASTRCTKSIVYGAKPILIAPPDAEFHHTLRDDIDAGKVEWIRKKFEDADVQSLGRDEVNNVVDAVFVTLGGGDAADTRLHISSLCRRLRIPVNVVDAPNLCTFTLPSIHSDGPLQIGITTSGKGCKLASRIRREVASLLPPNFGSAIDRLGTIRRRIWEEDYRQYAIQEDIITENEDDETPTQKSTFNQLVLQVNDNTAKTRRIRWLSQICEYWPLRRLASIADADISTILQSYASSSPSRQPIFTNSLDAKLRPTPRIILAGSGPGSPSLLTLATHRAIQTATLVLADKLVPAPILDLIPRRTPVQIARKFPGNADAAQEEFLLLGLQALQNGETVLRLKQGDPYIYGRGAEEYEFFRAKGYEPVVLPGITSALSAPLFARIPGTHRGIADQVLICTGTGRKGAAPTPPPYIPSQTVVFLMALHRIEDLVRSLVGLGKGDEEGKWPNETPCAIVERASCGDQRVIRSDLGNITEAFEVEGSRPPGLLVVGWSCNILMQNGGAKWVVEDGFHGLDGVDGADMVTEGLKQLAMDREARATPSEN
ncbi:MAG: hypothetical protein Q9167_007797 [Letrouitia subvulpina]